MRRCMHAFPGKCSQIFSEFGCLSGPQKIRNVTLPSDNAWQPYAVLALNTGAMSPSCTHHILPAFNAYAHQYNDTVWYFILSCSIESCLQSLWKRHRLIQLTQQEYCIDLFTKTHTTNLTRILQRGQQHHFMMFVCNFILNRAVTHFARTYGDANIFPVFN